MSSDWITRVFWNGTKTPSYTHSPQWDRTPPGSKGTPAKQYMYCVARRGRNNTITGWDCYTTAYEAQEGEGDTKFFKTFPDGALEWSRGGNS